MPVLQVQVHVWDTSEPYGAHYSHHTKVRWEVGASRDPDRWADWADIVLLVSCAQLCKSAQCSVMQVYSVTSKESLKEAFAMRERWADTAKAVVVVGNKNDLEIYRQAV